MKKIELNIDLEKLRYSLVGDGYILEEVEKMSEEKLISILKGRIYLYIEKEYYKGVKMGLYDEIK